jgi:hypothetical protein
MVYDRITEFLDFVHCPEFKIAGNITFDKLDPFPPSGDGREPHTLLRTLERANINHWTQLNTF